MSVPSRQRLPRTDEPPLPAVQPGGEIELSIIVPLWHDWPVLGRMLHGLRPLPRDIEIIAAAVGPVSVDALSREFDRVVRVPCREANRGAQMNAGAAAARGRILLFHHADSFLTHEHLDALRAAMNRKHFVGGAFHREFDERHPGMKRLEPIERWRCVHGRALFGDQSIFVRRDVFQALSGYAAIPLMEDFEFSRRLRKAGRLDILDPPMRTHARHHFARGPWRTTMRNLLFIVMYQCGASPWWLHRRYYRPHSKSTPEPGPLDQPRTEKRIS
ncbi:MAG: glycosyltransferase [Opitutaceae bacterium]